MNAHDQAFNDEIEKLDGQSITLTDLSFALGGIVLCQKSLIKMDDGVFLAGSASETFQQGVRIGMCQQFCQRINLPAHPFIRLGRNMLEKFA